VCARRSQQPKPLKTERRFLRVGKVADAHGLRGGLVVYSYTRPPQALVQYETWWIGVREEEARAYRLQRARTLPKRIVAFVEGIEDRTAAEALKGAAIFVPRSAVSVAPDEWLWEDLLGLLVRTQEGFELGKVVRVADFGAQDILIVEGKDQNGTHGEWMIPFTRDVILDVDLDAGRIVIAWLAGLEACFTPKF